MHVLQVSLSTQPAPAQWGENALLSWQTNGVVIHLPDTDLHCRLIRQAARKLDGMSLPAVALQGVWHKEQQWAFATSFTRANNAGQVTWCDNQDRAELEKAFTAVQFCRQLVNATPEVMSPEQLADSAIDYLTALAPEHIHARKISGAALLDEGWVGIYNVGRGSERPPVLLEVDFNPTNDPAASVQTALVGKGITFDSGGYSIKSSEGMLHMKCDMGGAATVTAALGLAISQGLSHRTKLYLCCAENLISGHAYKLGDILTYKNGVSVEIVNTDAEGRLVLADGLIAATESGAQRILDAATLTGAATVALGRDYHAVFSLDAAAGTQVLQCGAAENERFWPLPLEKWHQQRCPSPFADTANSRAQKGGGAGGASNAAGFLSRFVAEDGAGWVHLDLAAAYHDSSNDEMPAGATGIGVRTIANYLCNP